MNHLHLFIIAAVAILWCTYYVTSWALLIIVMVTKQSGTVLFRRIAIHVTIMVAAWYYVIHYPLSMLPG